MNTTPLARRLWLAACLAALVGIFVQSLLPPAVSGAESGRVAAVLEALFGSDSAFGHFLITYVRKIAHFAEYAVFGFLFRQVCAQYGWAQTSPFAPLLSLAGLPVGFMDETLQVFSHRGPAIVDVWIDAMGCIVGYFLMSLVLYIVRKRTDARR